MKFSIKPGYIVFDSKKPGPVYVAPHAAIAFEKMRDYQDSGTHFIVYMLAKSGGKAIISNITRERKIDFGIDFFRNPPPRKLAKKYYEIIRNSPKKKSYRFRKTYAWTAKSDKDHDRKKKTFNNFWKEINKNKAPVFFIHRQFLNPIRHPSIIDVIPFNYEERVKNLIPHLNSDYEIPFKKIFPFYKKAFFFKTDCILFKKKMEKSANIKMFRGKEPKIHRRLERFQEKVSDEPFIEITYKKNFTGKSIKKYVTKELLPTKHPIIELELSELLTERFPNIAVHIIRDMVKHMGFEKNI